MKYFPIFVNLKKMPVLVVGGGKVALRKAKNLSDAEAYITIIAPQIITEIETLPGVKCLFKPATTEDITSDFRLVILATDQPKLQEDLAAACRQKNLLFNRCDSPEESDFVTASIAENFPILAAFTASGSPTLSRLVRKRFEGVLEPAITDLGELLIEIRTIVKEKFPVYENRESFFRKLVTEVTIERIRNEGIEKIRQEVFQCLS